MDYFASAIFLITQAAIRRPLVRMSCTRPRLKRTTLFYKMERLGITPRPTLNKIDIDRALSACVYYHDGRGSNAEKRHNFFHNSYTFIVSRIAETIPSWQPG